MSEKFSMERLDRPATAAPALGGIHPRAGFLLEHPDLNAGGFNLNTGFISATHQRVLFGEWEQPEGLEGDADLAALRSLHTRAVGEWKAMAQTLQTIADDDDPALNDASRLKTAARVVGPKLDKLAGVAAEQLERADASIAAEEVAIAAAIKEKGAAGAVGAEIRAFWSDEARKPENIRKHLSPAIHDGTIDDDTLAAVAGVPQYMSGLIPAVYDKARALLAERIAPERAKRIAALRTGKARALQALSSLDRAASSLIDFKKAAKLAEKERSYV